jgi:RNA polymerase sigma factor (sigma-70 family)
MTESHGPNASFDELLELVAKGDGAALGRLLEAETPRLRRLLERRTPPELRREISVSDIVQEATLRIVRRSERLENRGLGAFRKLFELVARRLLINATERHRAQKRDVRRELREVREGPAPARGNLDLDELPGSSASPPRLLIERERIEGLRKCFALLPEADREILRLIDYADLEYGEAAGRLGVSEEAARKRHSRAVARLRLEMRDAGLADESEAR